MRQNPSSGYDPIPPPGSLEHTRHALEPVDAAYVRVDFVYKEQYWRARHCKLASLNTWMGHSVTVDNAVALYMSS